MRTRAGGDTLAAPGTDPPGAAARLRRAHPDPDVLGLRLLHVAVDAVTLVLLLAVPALATAVAVALGGPSAGPARAAASLLPTVALGLAGGAVLVGVGVLWPHHDGGRTAGMRWAGLRVVDRAGRPPSRRLLAVRALTVPLDLVVGPVLVLVRPDRRRLGDLLAGTQVVRDLSAAPGRAGRPGTATSPRARSRTAGPPPRR